MKGFVIYTATSSKSIEMAKNTQSMFTDIDVSLFKGVDKTNVWQTFVDSNFSILDITQVIGYVDGLLGNFYSHYNLWSKCIELNESILVLEHDAITNYQIDFDVLKKFKGDLLNLGEPHWGTHVFNGDGITKRKKGEHECLIGVHSYLVNPSGAKKLIDGTEKGILPADNYIRQELIDIYDYLPHPIKQSGTLSLTQVHE